MLRPIAFVAALAALSACGGSSPDYSGSYVGGDEQVLMQFNIEAASDGQISGDLAVASLDFAADKVAFHHFPVSGVRKDAQLDLIVPGRGTEDPKMTLLATGETLQLFVPRTGQTLELVPMSQEQYQQRVAEFAQGLKPNPGRQ